MIWTWFITLSIFWWQNFYAALIFNQNRFYSHEQWMCLISRRAFCIIAKLRRSWEQVHSIFGTDNTKTEKFLRLHIIPHQRTANISISGFWISGGEFQSQSFSAFCVIYKRKVVLFNHRKWAERGGFEKILGNLFRLHNFADELIYTAAVRSPRPTTARELPSWNKNSKDTPIWSAKMLAVGINQAFTDLKFERCGRKLLETSKHTLPPFYRGQSCRTARFL